MRAAFALATVLVAFGAADATAADAPPRWSAPRTLAAADAVVAPGVAVDADGVATITWIERGDTDARVHAMRCTPRRCGRDVTLSGAVAQASEAVVAVAADGEATVAWIERVGAAGSLHARSFRGGTWGPDALVYDAASPFDVDLAAFAGGSVAITHREIDGGRTVARASTCGAHLALCSVADLDAAGHATAVVVASNRSTGGLIAIATLDGADHGVAVAELRIGAGLLLRGATAPLTPALPLAVSGLAAAVDAGGNATVAWSEGGVAVREQTFALDAIPLPVAGVLVSAGADPLLDPAIAVAADGAGRATIIWAVTPARGQGVRSAVIANRAPGAPVDVIAPRQMRRIAPALAVAPASGRVVVAAARRHQVVTRIRFAEDATWTARATPDEGAGIVADVRVAAAPSGRTALIWTASAGGAERLRFAALEPAPRTAVARVRATAIATEVTSPVAGRARQVGRFRSASGRIVIGCRSTATAVAANAAKTIRCVLTAAARQARRAAALRMTITTTVRTRGGRPIAGVAEARLPRRS